MEGRIKYEDLVEPGIIQKLIDELKELKRIATSNPVGNGKQVKEFNTQLEKTVEINDDLMRLLGDRIVLQKQLEKAQTSYKKALDNDAASATKYAKIIEKTKGNLSRLGFEIKNVTKLTNAAQGSYEHKSQTLAKLRMEVRKMAVTDEKSTKVLAKKTKQITKLDTELKKFDASIGNHQRNVGNYSASIQDAAGQLGIMGNVMPKVRAGLNLVKAGFSSLRAVLISSGIGAIAVLIGSLAAYFTSTSEGAAKLQKVLTPLTETFKLMWDMLADLGQVLFNVFAAPKESMDKLVKEMKPFVDVVVKSIQVLDAAFKRDFAGMAVAMTEFNLAWDTAGQQVEGYAASFGEYMDENYEKLKRNIAAEQGFVDADLALKKKQLAYMTQIAQLEVTISRTREQAQKYQYKDAEAAIVFQEQAMAATKEKYALERELAAEELRIAEARLLMHDSTIEQQKEVAELKVNLIKIDQQQANGIRKLTSLYNTFINTAAAANKALDVAWFDSLALIDEATDKANTKRVKAEIKTYNDLQALYDEGVDSYKLQMEKRLGILHQALEIGFINQAQYLDMAKGLQEDYNNYVLKGELEKQSAMAASIATLVGSFGELGEAMGANAEQMKALRIAEAIINTYAGVTAALAMGPPAGFILAAAQLVAGLAAVATIANTPIPKFFKGAEYVGLGGNKRGRDTIPAMLNEGERVVPSDINKDLLGVKNKDLPGLVALGKAYQGGLLVDMANVANKIDKTNTLLSGWKFVSPTGEIIDLQGNKVKYV